MVSDLSTRTVRDDQPETNSQLQPVTATASYSCSQPATAVSYSQSGEQTAIARERVCPSGIV
jgi:hypothetical protein